MIQDCDFLLIGGGVGAYNAAKRLRRRDPACRIVMVSADTMAPYDLPPLSKEVLRGLRTEIDLCYPSLESQGLPPISAQLSTRVQELDPDERIAVTDTGERIRFRNALLATGGRPVELSVPGGTLPQVRYLRSADDCRALRAEAQRGRHAVVVGAGFIGVEVAASLRAMDVDVTLVEAADRVLPRFADAELAARIHDRCESHGVRVIVGDRVTAVEGDHCVTGVQTASGQRIACDFVCVGIGIRPNIELAQDAGLAVTDGIVVDEFMRTSAPGIYAAGDVASYPDPFLGRHVRAEHWGHAEYTGQIAATNMLGGNTPYDFLNYVWSEAFDWRIDSAGHVQDYDEKIIRGDPDGDGFTTLYFREHALVAYTSVNGQQSEFPAYRRLIRSRQALARPSDLSDTTILARNMITA